MQADISRNSFDPRLAFLRVIHQQGRPVLDAETNEQAAILLHYLTQLAADLIGPAAGPEHECGFRVTLEAEKGKKKPAVPRISAGRYYVNGLLCENPAPWPIYEAAEPPPHGTYLIYLDVWEQFVGPLDHPEIADPALSGVTTTARSSVAWRVRRIPCESKHAAEDAAKKLLEHHHPAAHGRMRVQPVAAASEAQESRGSAAYTGENQLYRVEFHTDRTIKWARDNASNVFPVSLTTGAGPTLEDLGRDDRTSLVNDGIVELLHHGSDGHGTLHKICDISPSDGTFTLHPPVAHWHPGSYLRRWDHTPNNGEHTIDMIEGSWIELEQGLSVLFVKDKANAFRRGDYWLVPARSTTQAALWSKQDAEEGRAADGTYHHYAPLAIITMDAGGGCDVVHHLTKHFKPLHVEAEK